MKLDIAREAEEAYLEGKKLSIYILIEKEEVVDSDGCHLFLWVTHKYLPEGFKVMDMWGFRYHCCLTWDKTYGFTPFSFMWSTEFCLYGQLKDRWMKPQRIGLKILVTEKPREHSRKPEAMYELIEQYASGNKIELFARNKRDGWDCWGNEVESDVEL